MPFPDPRNKWFTETAHVEHGGAGNWGAFYSLAQDWCRSIAGLRSWCWDTYFFLCALQSSGSAINHRSKCTRISNRKWSSCNPWKWIVAPRKITTSKGSDTAWSEMGWCAFLPGVHCFVGILSRRNSARGFILTASCDLYTRFSSSANVKKKIIIMDKWRWIQN